MNRDQSFKNHLEDYLPKIRKIVQKIAGNEGVIDDITQECCVRIIEKEHLYQPELGKMEQWIGTITRNFTRTYLKRQPKRQALDMDSMELPETPTEPEFSEEHIGWVLSQFHTLPKGQKEILQLRYFNNMKVTDIANQLGVTKQTVSNQIASAIKILKKRARAQGLLVAILPWNWFSKNKTNQTGYTVVNWGGMMKFVIIFGLAASGIWVSFDFSNSTKTHLNPTNLTMSSSNESGVGQSLEGSKVIRPIPHSELEKPPVKAVEKKIEEVDRVPMGNVIDGFALGLRADKSKYQLLDDISFTCTAYNKGESTISILTRSEYLFGTFYITDPTGQEYAYDPYAWKDIHIPTWPDFYTGITGGSSTILFELTCNKAHAANLFASLDSPKNIHIAYPFTKKGKYTIVCKASWTRRQSNLKSEEIPESMWFGSLQSNTIEIIIE